MRTIVVIGWDGLSQPIYRYRDELHLPRWQQKRPSQVEIDHAKNTDFSKVTEPLDR